MINLNTDTEKAEPLQQNLVKLYRYSTQAATKTARDTTIANPKN
jgi:hypothetical protein